MSEPSSPTEQVVPVVKEKFHLDILNLSQTSQIQFGIRLQDYQKYRQYCSKRLDRIRGQLRKQYGKKQFINKVTDAKLINDSRYLVIALLKAERAWSYANDLKAAFEKKGDSRIAFHMSRRFSKAASNADQLLMICKEVADQYTIVEAEAYAAWMNSSNSIVKKYYQNALDEISASKQIYVELAKSGDHAQKDLYEKRIEESEPIIRFCLYNLKSKQEPEPSEEIEELLNQLKSSDSNNTSSDQELPMQLITWKSKTIKTDEKLREKLVIYSDYLKANQSKLPQTQSDIQTLDLTKNISQIFEVYDKLVYHLINCENIIKNELSALIRTNLKNKTVKSEIEESSQKILLSFVLYHKCKYLYERNTILIRMMQGVLEGEKVDESAIKKKANKVTYNDLVRLSTHQVKVFTILNDSKDDPTAAQKDVARDNDAQLILLKSQRLFFIGICLSNSHKYSETMSLFDRVLTNLANVKKTNTRNQLILSETSKLEESINQQRSQIHANSFIQQLSTNQDLKNQMSSMSLTSGTTGPTKSLINNLDSFETSFLQEKNLVDLPPQLEPVPVKPLFFDLAFNNVSFPTLDIGKSTPKKSSSTSTPSTPNTQDKSTPSKGLFSSFWGR
ncbi:hypothetical protein DICPUDRAFT_53497 [Dictyostelium purpureum]|uniref:Signal recognition particle subunit SRP68 n=1 Tax=Dictyostelium purpureum TaxID=5786 RepID=F0ZD61_DICPU|nr:uncharacterized protein DICPUDRAFT_53497 [Dictyostelium purpureum]EGC38121.1 hypothetical protein DICPUDRAFT_53497 [Dictyostelium purpureum]|eukprot:XP_003285335.1 hypothetical protein DICPUDRAFT_53497 [Dictyostelium purpureum]